MWTVYKKDGTAAGCTVWSLEYHGERMGERYVSADIESAEPLSLGVGDWIEYRGERFVLGSAADISKSAPSGAYGAGFTCKGVRFMSLSDELTRCSFLDIVGGDNKMHYTGLPKFSFFCSTVEDFARRIQANLDRAYTGSEKWTVVCDPALAEKGNVSLSADGKSVWEMLSELPDKFGCNFTVSGRTLTIGVKPVEAGKVFMWGKDGGLDGVDVSGDSSQQVITRVRVYGSTKNMPERYYNKMSDADGKKYVPDNMAVSTLMLPSFPKTTLDPYIDSGNIGELGVREGVVYFDGSGDNEEIYPTMEGMTAEDLRAAGVSISLDEGDNGNLDEVFAADAVEADGYVAQGQTVSPSTFKITLKDIGFDINGQLTSSTAKISMKDGMCGGREFEITGCAKSGNKYVLTCKRTLDSDLDLYFPYKDYNVKAGDRFVLLDISMPEAYIQAASGRLLLKGTEWLAKNCEPKRTVTPKIYSIYMARQHDEALKSGGVSLHDTLREGMRLHVKDDDLGIDTVIGIKTLTIKEGGNKTVPEYEVTLDDDDDTGTISRMQESIDGIVSGEIKISGETVIKNSPWLKSALAGKLSKTDDDTAEGEITFRKGLKVGDGSRGVDAAGNAVLKGVSSETISNSGNITNGGDIENRNGRTTTKDLTVTDAASVRSLTVTGKATFFELEVQRASAAGGLCIYSAGTGKIDLVEPVYETEDTTKVKGWKCYQLAKDADGTSLQQMFKEGDNLVSFSFNTGAGYYTGTANRWWWRRCTQAGFTYKIKNGQRYISFTVNKTLCAEGSDEPKVGDKVCVLGNRSDIDRQKAIIISAYGGLDAGLIAPYIAQYTGINDFDLASHRKSHWGYDAMGNPDNKFIGNFVIQGNGGTDTPLVRDLGEWQAGTYYYYDRVSYKGSLYLMTNKASGTTTGVPGVSADWTLQVANGAKGADGADAVIYQLVPNAENVTLLARGSVVGALNYSVYLKKGDTLTLIELSNDVYWRWKTENSNEWSAVRTEGNVPISYDFANDASENIVVTLIIDGVIQDTRIVRITANNDAFVGYVKATNTINATVQKQTNDISDLTQSSLQIKAETASLSSRMGKAEARVETSVQYDPETGKVTSNVTLSADRIDLEGAVSANGEFRIDTWGNVMTGTQYGTGTATYIAEDKSNLIFTSYARVSLPNDAEFIGRRMLIMAQPRHNSAGVVLKADGGAVTDVSQYPKVEIVTGNVFVRGVYGTSVLDGAEAPDAVVEQSDADGSPYWGVRWFGGSRAFLSETGGTHWQQPSLLTLRGGYVELLGVEYSVSRLFRSETPELDGTLWSVHMARVAEDGTVTTADPYSEKMTISDTDEYNGSIEALESGEATPWEKAERLCLWTVVGVGAQEFTAGLR